MGARVTLDCAPEIQTKTLLRAGLFTSYAEFLHWGLGNAQGLATGALTSIAFCPVTFELDDGGAGGGVNDSPRKRTLSFGGSHWSGPQLR